MLHVLAASQMYYFYNIYFVLFFYFQSFHSDSFFYAQIENVLKNMWMEMHLEAPSFPSFPGKKKLSLLCYMGPFSTWSGKKIYMWKLLLG